MFQDIDTDSALAINEVCFGVPGFGLNGALTIQVTVLLRRSDLLTIHTTNNGSVNTMVARSRWGHS